MGLVASELAIMSPLLSKKSSDDLSTLSPFRAVPRCGRAIGGEFNVILRNHTATLPGWLFQDNKDKKPSVSKAVMYKVSFQVIRIPEAIEEGDALCYPFYDHEETQEDHTGS